MTEALTQISEHEHLYVIYCETCKRSLYAPTEDNLVTRSVAQQAAQGHMAFFHAPHSVIIIPSNQAAYRPN